MPLVNKYHNVPYDVYIGRGSPYGNPYVMGIDGDRTEVIDKYRQYFYKRIEEDLKFKELVTNLKCKTLACFCSPKACHGDVILSYLQDGAMPSIFDPRCLH